MARMMRCKKQMGSRQAGSRWWWWWWSWLKKYRMTVRKGRLLLRWSARMMRRRKQKNINMGRKRKVNELPGESTLRKIFSSEGGWKGEGKTRDSPISQRIRNSWGGGRLWCLLMCENWMQWGSMHVREYKQEKETKCQWTKRIFSSLWLYFMLHAKSLGGMSGWKATFCWWSASSSSSSLKCKLGKVILNQAITPLGTSLLHF